MPEVIAGKKAFSLFEIAESVRKVIAERYTSRFWVKAELNKLNYYSNSGHCYPELVQKEDGKIKAEFRSVLWKNDFTRINRQFQTLIGESLRDGIKILFEASISFDALYGITLRIHEIDVNYTLGDLEAEKQASIQRLKIEGVFDRNKEIEQALLPRRIAIISVDTSKGYADFCRILESCKDRFTIFHMLFPALLQGDKAAESIEARLNDIRKVAHHFDVVAIIRGGGGEVGLTCFNHLGLARAIATFPLPVYTGIGHATNETVCEMVSYFNGITPTKVAEHVLAQFERFERVVQTAEKSIGSYARNVISEQNKELRLISRILRQSASKHKSMAAKSLENLRMRVVQGNRFYAARANLRLENLASSIKAAGIFLLQNRRSKLTQITTLLTTSTSRRLLQQRDYLTQQERLIQSLDPINTLKRGYSITLKNGRAVTTFESLQQGDVLETLLANGSVHSLVQNVKSHE